MPRLAYLNEQAVDSLVTIQPWAHSARVSPGGRVEIVFETRGVDDPEIRIAHRDAGAVEITLGVRLVSISGDGVAGLTAD